MDRQATQFALALAAIFFLGVCTIIALIGEVFYDSRSELTVVLVTTLGTITVSSATYFFRVNGSTGGK